MRNSIDTRLVLRTKTPPSRDVSAKIHVIRHTLKIRMKSLPSSKYINEV